MESNYYRFGLLGFPIEHSLSPKLHNFALEENNLKGDYSLFSIQPGPEVEQNIQKLIDQVRRQEIQGINVTIPYKQIVIPFVDELTLVAQATGAVNTILMHNNRLVGENTDVFGFGTDLRAYLKGNSGIPKVALVFGAGGASRAVVYYLGRSGWTVYISARRKEQVDQLIQDLSFHLPLAELYSIENSPEEIQEISNRCSLYINATPLGMAPDFDSSPWPKALPYPEQALFYDLICNPLETQFLQIAHRSGLPYRNGLGMLVAQAAQSFSLWTGMDYRPEWMLKALE